ncbi:IPTL-CTERM sorting domain-containing protein [Comamonas serinivorans]|nr:IPTL-CTERM sorting domain-containing protein [Comamonas serinivorans]
MIRRNRPASRARWTLVMALTASAQLAHAACVDNADRAQAPIAGDTCLANGSSYLGSGNANNTLLASGAGSTLTVANTVTVNPGNVSSSGGQGVVSAFSGGHVIAQGGVTVIQRGGANSYGISAGGQSATGGTVDIAGPLSVTMSAAGQFRRAVMANGATGLVTIGGHTTIRHTGGSGHRGLSAEGGGTIHYTSADIDFTARPAAPPDPAIPGDTGSNGIRVLTDSARLHGTGNTDIRVEGTNSIGLLTNANAESTIDGWLRINVGPNGASAANIQGNATVSIGPNSALNHPTGSAVVISSAHATPLVAGPGLTMAAVTGFTYTGAIAPETTLTNATVTATTLWHATSGAEADFTAHGGGYTGTSTQDGTSTLTVTLADAAVWHLNADATLTTLNLESNGTLEAASASRTVTGDVKNISGLVDLSGTTPQTGDTFTVGGNHTGGGGTVRLDTALGDSASPTDVLHITGDNVNGGNTQLDVRNLGGAGAATTGDGILVVQVDGDSSGTFTLANSPLDVGGFRYSLVQVGSHWYLQSQRAPVATAKPVPTLDAWALAALAGLLGGVGWRRRRTR